VKEALDAIYSDVSEMNNSVQNMISRLQATKTQTHHLIDQTTKLQAERYCMQH
jgi:regulator of replication initiation timing